jgi:SAM-dependent methyltransferase/acyl carrier protein
LEITLRALPDILKGKQLAKDVLFPHSSMELVEGIYKEDPLSEYFNRVLAYRVAVFVQERRRQESSAKVRILEVGAGTGGTSFQVFKHLELYRDQIEEYCYTDVSKAFLMHAKRQYGEQVRYLTYGLVDVEKPLDEQSLLPGSYDLVVAANVLHATKNVRVTLRNIKAALKRNGVLVLNEIVGKSLFTHLTFALLADWWKFEDTSLRIPGSPGLQPHTWRQVLQSEGFRVGPFTEHIAKDLGQEIIVAASDGVIRQRHPGEERTNGEVEKRADAAFWETAPYQTPVKLGSAHTKTERRARSTSADNDHGAEAYVQEAILGTLSQCLQIDPNAIDPEQPFSEYGLDSIIGIEAVEHINQALAIALPTNVLSECQSVRTLATHILSMCRESISADINRKVSIISSSQREEQEKEDPLALGAGRESC